MVKTNNKLGLNDLPELICLDCGATHPDGQSVKPCACGSNKWTFTVHEVIGRQIDLAKLKVKDDQGVAAKMKFGGSRSADGSVAGIEQIVNYRTETYKKKVTLADGTVEKDVEGPLTDQTLHGSQKK